MQALRIKEAMTDQMLRSAGHDASQLAKVLYQPALQIDYCSCNTLQWVLNS